MEITAKDWYEQCQTEKIGSHDICYNRAGSGEVLVCIHGFPSSSWDFAPIWSDLTARFDVIATDLMGLGQSAKPHSAITVGMQADAIEGLLTSKGITKAHILAHDLGDTVAQELLARLSAARLNAARIHQSVSGVEWQSCVFLNGGIFPETHRPLLIQKVLISPIGGLVVKLMKQRTFEKSMTRVFSKAHPPSQEFLDETWRLTAEDGGLAMIPRLIRYMAERVKNRERWVTPLVDQVVPMRLIDGVEDPISGQHMADRFAEVVPDADIAYLQNSGHYPHVETPREVLKAFLEFHEGLVRSPLD